jgi:integrase/recombinase XerD
MKLKEATTKFCNYMRVSHSKAGLTYGLCLGKFNDHINKDLEQIDNDDIIAFQLYLKEKSEPATQAMYASALRMFFKFCNRRGWSKVIVDEISVPRVPEKIPVFVEQWEFETLCDIAKEDPIKLLVLHFLWYTGVRCQELCDINIESLNLRDQSTQIMTLKAFRPRFIFWPAETNVLIKLVIGERTNGALFTSGRGTRLIKRNVERWVKAMVDEAGIDKDIVPHSFRHGFVHENLNIGTDLPAIQAMVGHRNPESIFKYTKRLDHEIKEVARESIRKRSALLQINKMGKF